MGWVGESYLEENLYPNRITFHLNKLHFSQENARFTIIKQLKNYQNTSFGKELPGCPVTSLKTLESSDAFLDPAYLGAHSRDELECEMNVSPSAE